MKQKKTISQKYASLKPWLDDIDRHFEQEGEVVYTGRNLIKEFKDVRGNGVGHDVNVKRYHSPRGINALIYSLGIRSPKGVRAYEYARILTGKGIGTAEPIAYIENRDCWGVIKESYLVTQHVPFNMEMYDIGNAPEGTYEDLAQSLAAFTADLHDKEIMHKDYTPGNILVSKTSGGGYSFTLVDINRMYFGKVTMEMACKNLCRLWGPKRFMQILIEEYASRRGFDKDAAASLLMKNRAQFWTRYQRKHKVKFNLEL